LNKYILRKKCGAKLFEQPSYTQQIFSLNALRDQVSDPYIKTGKSIVASFRGISETP
jgi:hypothetical protein